MDQGDETFGPLALHRGTSGLKVTCSKSKQGLNLLLVALSSLLSTEELSWPKVLFCPSFAWLCSGLWQDVGLNLVLELGAITVVRGACASACFSLQAQEHGHKLVLDAQALAMVIANFGWQA